jgi:hypothetical protein
MKRYSLVLSTLLVLLIAGCKKSEAPTYDRAALLDNMANGLILPGYEQLRTDLTNLETAASTFHTTTSAENLAALRSAFLDAYLSFQAVKMYDFGPAADYAFKAACNTYPTNTTKIDENISSGSYILGAAENTAAIGFPALDYLYYNGDDVTIINQFTTDPDANARKTYVDELIIKMKTELEAIISSWNGSYRATFLAANGTDVGSSISLMYNEWVKDIELLKNAKIGIPAGLFSGGEQFPDYVEAYYSGYSKTLALASLNALEQVFLGATGEGMDDNMSFEVENGTAMVSSSEITDQFSVCRTKIEALGEPFSESIPANPAGFNEAFQEIKKLVAYAKTDIPAILGVLITYSDTDGD